MTAVLHTTFAVLPVLVFLAGLQVLDSFKLVRSRHVIVALGVGALAAAVCVPIHTALRALWHLDGTAFSRYVAPLTEEAAKGAILAWLVFGRRVGFAVDAAILGFAVGAGFGVFENVTYLVARPAAPALLWLVRGLGTAMLHGAIGAIVTMLMATRAERYPDEAWRAVAPAWAIGVGLHSAFNHAALPPLATTLLILMVLPLLVLATFARSERTTREWVTEGLDLDLDVLQIVASDAVQTTRFGRHLHRLRERFDARLVLDMYCLLRLQLELTVQAKALVLARQHGLDLPADDDVPRAFAELAFLQRSIGPTGLLALESLQVVSGRDHWHRVLLADRDPRTTSESGDRVRE